MKKIAFLFGLVLMSSFAFAAEPAFDDVYVEHFNNEAISALQNDNVIEGYSDGTYKPENRINRAEFIKIIVASKVKNPTGSNCLSDIKNEWFAKYVCTAKRLGWIEGYPDGTYKPSDFINFAEASKIITKAMGVTEDTAGTNKEWFAGFVKGMENKKAIPTTIQYFDREITRGEMAEMVWRLNEKKEDKITATYTELTSEFPNIQSCPALKEKFDEYQSYQYYPRYEVDTLMQREGDMVAPESMPATAGSAKGAIAADEASTDFSTTNIQVAGVDEADIIKNDGQYIYTIKNDTVRIIKAYPPSQMKEVTVYNFKDYNFEPQELYINENQLIAIGQTYASFERPALLKNILPPYPYNGVKTKVYILNVSDKANVKEERVVTYDGSYHTSRRIKDDLYVVANEQPYYWGLDEVKNGEDLIPRMQDGSKAEERMVNCADIRYFPGYAQPNYLIVSSIPLDNPTGEIDREIFLGNSDNIYASRTHLYVAANQFNYGRYTDWNWSTDRIRTSLYKFSLQNGQIDFVAHGSVPGTILNQFSMDAYKDTFRIATTTNDNWPDPSNNNVYVLDAGMNTVGEEEDIAPGESIFSTRFLGDRLYMVTFRQVDPLFVIDLSDPTNPTILGKLKIPGFSNYIHPYDENHIIGFGKETAENEWGGVVTAGFKMALFDVSDVTNPIQKFVEVIGDSGTDSELLNNHKALLFDKEKGLLAFPIHIQEKVTKELLQCNQFRSSTCPDLCTNRCIPTNCTEGPNGESICTDDCDGLGSCIEPDYEQYATTFVGAIVYNLNLTNGFTEKGRITHFNDEDELKLGDWWPYYHDSNVQRIIYIGEYLYTISQNRVKANNLSDIKEVKVVELAD